MAVLASPDVGIRGRALLRKRRIVHLFGMAARSVVMSEAFGRVEWPFLSRKDPHLPTFGQKLQCPLQHDEESVRKSDQEIDVHNGPDNPGRKSGESEHAKIGERVSTPRDSEITFVPIPEGGRRRPSRRAPSNQGCHVPSCLNGRLRNARHDHRLFGRDPQQIPRMRNDVRRVANCKNLRMIRH